MWQDIKNIYHFFQALSSSIFFNFPSKKITIVGVTGTDGKTTTTSMIYHILVNSGYKAALVNSLGAKIGDKLIETGYHVTTPSPYHLQKLLKKAKDLGLNFIILEVTSHGLDQQRLAFIDFKVAAITNVTSDHIDYHKTWHKYLNSKSKLFKKVAFSVLNLDDASYKYLKNRASGKILTYSVSKDADFNLKNFPIKLKILGQYNLQNALASAAVATALKIDKKDIIDALKTFEGVKGRMQKIDLGQDFRVFVDFAHTPNGLENALHALKSKLQKGGKLIAVFGSAGQRDNLKRPMMGKIADKIADIIVLTSEDPRNDDPQKICEEIARGIDKKVLNKDYYIIVDRKQAIEFAVQIAKNNDTIGLFGKGHEKSQALDSKEYPWDEVKAATDAIKKRLKRK